MSKLIKSIPSQSFSKCNQGYGYDKFFFCFTSCRSSVVQADGVGAGGTEECGNLGSVAAAPWRAAEGRLSGLPVRRLQPPGDLHAGVLQSPGRVCLFGVGPIGTHPSGQSTNEQKL